MPEGLDPTLLVGDDEWDERIRVWRNVVMEVAEGYRATIYDYFNDLDHRDACEEAVRRSGEQAAAHRSELEEADARFRTATWVIADSPFVQPSHDAERHWWRFRVPFRPGEELRADLGERGVTFPD